MAEPLGILGLARKARALELGAEFSGAAARARKARLLLLSQDASENTKSRAENFARAGNVQLLPVPYTMYELGGAVGAQATAVLAFTDAGLAAAFVKALSVREPELYAELLAELTAKSEKLLKRRRETQRKAAAGKRRNMHG